MASYRKSPTNIENRKDVNDAKNKQLPKETRIELQYCDGQGKNSILLYLMKYPSKILLDYFIKELKISIYLIYIKEILYIFYLIILIKYFLKKKIII